MFGYAGRSVRVDLTERRVEVFETPGELCRDFMGGRGFGVRLLEDRITMSPYAPEMPLVLAAGPLVGTAAPTSGRMAVVSRSPLTGTIFDCSVGGRFGTEMKKAGFDFIEITGVSDTWAELRIEDGSVRITDARDLAGMNTGEVTAHFGKGWSCAVIGRAGERQVRLASIVFDGHYLAGRGGLGAVMGVKRLKAITARGNGTVPVADPGSLSEARDEIMRLLRASPSVFGEFGLSAFGTAGLVDLIHARRMEPTGNFRKTLFKDASRYSGYAMKTRYGSRRTGCAGCPILCKKLGRGGEVIPEFETVSHFGALNECSDLRAIVEANRLCNDYGLDSISSASTLSCYAELRGERVEPAEMLRLLREIGEREGEGADLAEGSYRYAAAQGRPDLSMSVKGLELPAYDPRGAYGMALSYATSNRGGCHLRGYPISHEILRKPVASDRFSFEGKARIIKIAEDMNAVVDSLTACKFVFFAAGLEEYARAVNAVTGMEHDVQSLLRIGERIWNLERRMNGLNGFNMSHDDLPARFFSEEGTSGSTLRVPPIDRDAFLKARDDYYMIRGYRRHGTADP